MAMSSRPFAYLSLLFAVALGPLSVFGLYVHSPNLGSFFASVITPVTIVLGAVSAGLGLATWLKPLLEYKSEVTRVCWSALLGLMSYFLLVLTWGHLGNNISSSALWCIYLLLCGLNLIVGWFFRENLCLHNTDTPLPVTMAGGGELAVLITFLCSVILCNPLPLWDVFTFWLVDAKQIFLAKELLGDVAPGHVIIPYSSFYPLHAVALYEIHGGLREGYAGLYSVIYPALFIGIVTERAFSVTPKLTALLVLSSLLLAIYSMIDVQAVFYSFYADSVNATLVGLLAYVTVVSSFCRHPAGKLFLLAIVFSCFLLLKPTNLYYGMVMGVFALTWAYYERRSLSSQGVGFASWLSAPNVAVLVAVSVVWFSRKFYLGEVLELRGRAHSVNPISNEWSDFSELFDRISSQIVEMVFFIWGEHNTYIISLVFLAVYAVVTRCITTKSVLIMTFLLALPFLNIVDYAINMKSFTSQSLNRYVTISSLAIPCAFLVGGKRISTGARSFLNGDLSVVVGLVAISASFSLVLYQSPRLSFVKSPRFSDIPWHAGLVNVAAMSKEISEERPILVLGDGGVIDTVSNFGIPEIYLKYYLMPATYVGFFEEEVESGDYSRFFDALDDNLIEYVLLALDEDSELPAIFRAEIYRDCEFVLIRRQVGVGADQSQVAGHWGTCAHARGAIDDRYPDLSSSIQRS